MKAKSLLIISSLVSAVLFSQVDMNYQNAIAQYENENYLDAISALSKSITQNATYEAVKLKADCYHKIEDYRNAVEYYIQAEEMNPFDSKLYTHRAAALMSTNDLELAIGDLKRALSLDPGNDEAYYYLGNWYFENFKLKQAIKSYNRALEINPEYTEALYMRAASYAESKEFQKAEDDFRTVRKNDPSIVQASYNIAMLKFDSEQYAEALDDLNALEDGFADNSEYYYFRAETKYLLKDKENACFDYRTAADLGDADAENIYYKICQKELGKKPKGRKKSYMTF